MMQVKVAKKTVLGQWWSPSWSPFWAPKGAQERPKSSPREAQELPRGLQKWLPESTQFFIVFLMIFYWFFGAKIKAKNNQKWTQEWQQQLKPTSTKQCKNLCEIDIFTKCREMKTSQQRTKKLKKKQPTNSRNFNTIFNDFWSRNQWKV